MAHEITVRADGRAEMAFVGATPWHSLGNNVTKNAPISVWQKEAGFDWEALSETPEVFHCDPAITKHGAPAMRVDFSDYQALYRSDNMAPLAIVGKDYKPVQPRKMLEFFRGLTESGGWHIHTAGTLRGGRRLWVLATCEDPFRFVRGYAGDKVALNLLLATSLDGSMKTVAMLTTVRVVCANTLRLALEEQGRFAQVNISHRSDFDDELIKSILGVDSAHKTFDAFMEQARQLAETPIDLSEAREVLLRVFKPSTVIARPNLSWMGNIAEIDAQQPEPQETRAHGRILELFDGAGMGAGLATAAGTRWGLLNAITQYVDHELGRTPDTRLNEAWFGRGRDYKQAAVELLTSEG